MSRTFTDRYGTALVIGGEASFAGCARLTVSKLCGIHMEAADFPALIAELYEAAELPAPVILERQEIDPEGAAAINVFTVGLDRDLNVCVSYGKQKPIPVAPSVARNEPDPAEVEELAYVLRAVTPGMAYPGEGDYKLAVARGFAEAALKWMREREAAK